MPAVSTIRPLQPFKFPAAPADNTITLALRTLFFAGKLAMKLFRRLAGHSPWAVAAACALGLTRPVPAQAPARQPAASAPAAGLRDGDAINIQVAWLGDPALFGCSLVCRPVANGLELAGYVPSEPVRQRALHIARNLTDAAVVDHLKVQPGMPVSLPRPAAPAELAPQASAMLAEALGEKVLGLRVVCPSDGRVEVNGTVPSAADKLVISKTLKKLRGCTQVVNKVGAPASGEEAAVVVNIPTVDSLPPVEAPPAEPKPAVAVVQPAMAPVIAAPLPPVAPPKLTPEPRRVVERVEAPPAVTKMPTPRTPPRPPSEPATSGPRGNWAQPQLTGRSTKVESPMPVLPPPRNTKVADAAAANDLVVAEMTGPKLMGPPAPKEAPAVVTASAVEPKPESPAPKPLIAEPIVSRPEPAASRSTKPALPRPILPEWPKSKPAEPAVVTKPAPKPASTGYGEVAKSDNKPAVAPRPVEPKPEPPKPVVSPAELPAPAVVAAPVMPAPLSEPTMPVLPAPAEPVPPPASVVIEPISPSPVLPAPVLPAPVDTPKPAIEAAKTPEPALPAPKLPEPTPPVAVALPEEPKPAPPAKPKVVVENPPAIAPIELVPEMPQVLAAAPVATPKPPVEAPPAPPVVVSKAPEISKEEPAKPIVQPPPAPPVVVSKAPEIKREEPAKPGPAPLVLNAVASPKRIEIAPRTANAASAPEPKRLDLAAEAPKSSGSASPSRIEFNAVTPKLTERAPRPTPVEAPRPLVAAAPVEPKPVAETVRSAKHDVAAAEPAAAGTSFKGVIRQTAQMDAPTLDADTVRRAVDDICRGRATDVRVTPTSGRQLTVAVRVRNHGEWDRLCKDIKALPEVSGYSIIYDVTVAANARRDDPLPGGPSAPLMGVLRSATNVPAVGPDAVRAAIEAACNGRADDVSVQPNARQQVSVSLKVRSAAEWDRLYKEIKAMPEVAGYAVIYNVAVKSN